VKKRLFYHLLSWLLALSTIFIGLGLSPAEVQAAKPDKPPKYQPYNGHHPTNEERKAAAKAAKVGRAQAVANGVAAPALVATPGGTPDYFGASGNFANSPLPTFDANGNVVPGSGMRKFVDGLPGLGPGGANNLGQYISVANADTITYPGSDYYEIAAVEYTMKMHSDLPPTTLRGYVQLNNGTNSGTNTNTVAPSPVQYLGPAIVATANRPVRIKFTNLLPTTASGGDLFLPSDTTIMGAGMGPNGGAEMYPDNRATIHLHGGLTPWVSDGTPHQWVAPNLESTVAGRTYLKGASTQDVPDMPVSPGGSMTFYYSNAQSARLMFYHDHALGITRLNVYLGIAAPYILTDPTEQALINGGTIGTLSVAAGTIPATEIPLVIQDKTFVPSPAQLAIQDPTWNWGSMGKLWYPHVYMPNQNPFSPAGVTPMGRWDYGPWFGIPGILNGPVSNPYYVPGGTEPPQMPGTPNVSIVGETFFDTPVVNGTAYPTLTLQPQAYRFRILSAGDDRGWNLSLFKAAPLTITVTTPGSGYTTPPAVAINGGSVSGASAAASLGLVSVNVTAAGGGYTSAPDVIISPAAGTGGSGASAAAIMTGTSVPASWLPVKAAAIPPCPRYPSAAAAAPEQTPHQSWV
jgi:FtsP/CotA-like multicopper oxidase with cupredoxin domain